MAQKERQQLQGGWLSCVTERDGVRIVGYEGRSRQLHIPARIDGRPVTAVGKKAFWGDLCLASVRLPDTVEEIADWAFAGCRMLREVWLPGGELCVSSKAFHNSGRLKKIVFPHCTQSLARLAAMAVTELEAGYLLDPAQAGSDKWFQSLDARILEVLYEPEETALKELVYCAEEDMLAKQEACLRDRELRKAKIALFRLVHPEGMDKSTGLRLSEYLCRRTKGCAAGTAWEAVKQSREEQLRYCDKMIEIGGIGEHNIDAVLRDLDHTNVELKAYLLKRYPESARSSGIWETLEL